MKALPLMDSFYLLAPENEISVNLPSGFTESIKIKSLKKFNRYALVSFYGVNDPETALKYGVPFSALIRACCRPYRRKSISMNRLSALLSIQQMGIS